TYLAQRDLIKLEDELQYIHAYIELEELRHYEKSFVKWDMVSMRKDLEIPPYILSPLVENALKHGAYSEADPLQISLQADAEVLRFEVRNKIGKQKKDKIGGIGLDNLESRLKILYPDKHLLQAGKVEDMFIAL